MADTTVTPSSVSPQRQLDSKAIVRETMAVVLQCIVALRKARQGAK
jgi:hypothetical protein